MNCNKYGDKLNQVQSMMVGIGLDEEFKLELQGMVRELTSGGPNTDPTVLYEELLDEILSVGALLGIYYNKNGLISLMKNPVREEDYTVPTLDDLYNNSNFELNSNFLEDIFKGANSVKNNILPRIISKFADVILFDRNTKEIIDPNQINSRILEYLLELYNIVKEYLTNEYNITDVNDDINYKDLNRANQIFGYLNRANLARMAKSKGGDPQKLLAYVALLTLLNFNNFTRYIFGKSIVINNDVNSFSGKYELLNKLTNMAWSNSKDDDIDVIKSINSISKLLVSSTPLYSINGLIIEGRYIAFDLFINLVARIKDLMINSSVLFNEPISNFYGTTGRNPKDIYNLSSETKLYLNTFPNGTMLSLLGDTRRNPTSAYNAIFEILSKAVLSTKNSNEMNKILKSFNLLDKQTLISVYNGIFGEGSLKSVDLASLYLSFILQTCDSTWLVRNCQYWTDDNGNPILRSLLGNSIDRFSRTFIDTVNNFNTPYIASLNGSDLFEAVLENKTLTINFKNEDGVYTRDQITYSKDGLQVKCEDKLKLEEFINQVLQVDLSNELFRDLIGWQNLNTLNNLLRFCSTIIARQLAAKKVSVTGNFTNEQDHIEKLRNLLPTNEDLKINVDYKTIDLVGNENFPLVQNIVTAIAIALGISGATLVQDSEGKAIANTAPSRLLATYQMLLEQIRKYVQNNNSPVLNLSLLREPSIAEEEKSKGNTFNGIIKGLYTVREYVTADDSKLYNTFNTREFAESSIIPDFILPLISLKDNNRNTILKNRTEVAFIPSVNADKNTISKLIIDIDYHLKKLFPELITPEERIKAVLTLPDKIQSLIKEELGGYYSTLVNIIELDYAKMMEYSDTWKNVLGDFEFKYDYKSFENINQRLAAFNRTNGNNMTIRELYNTASIEVQKIHPDFKVNEELHGVFKKGEVLINRSIEGLNLRYLNDLLMQEFFQKKEAELLESLLLNKVKLSTEGVLGLWLKDNDLEHWINSDGRMILGYTSDGLTNRPVTDLHDLPKDLQNYKIELNPLIKALNNFHHLYSLEFLMVTVGSHVNHTNKKYDKNAYKSVTENGVVDLDPISYLEANYDEYINDESERFNAQNKRNVAFTASVHEFALNDPLGIPTNYNVAIILDIQDLVYNFVGDLSEIKPYDGATFVNPFIVYLENNSLKGEKAGIHKKQFVHAYDLSTGTGIVVKTAGFGITNAWLRDMPVFGERLMRKMTDIQWNLTDEQKTVFDISLGYDGNAYYKKDIYNPLTKSFVTEYYRIISLKKIGPESYEISLLQVDESGKPMSDDYTFEKVNNINSNYLVWKSIFKGTKSVSFHNGKLTNNDRFGEGSIILVTNIMNTIGFDKQGNFTTLHNLRESLKRLITLDDFTQPMKFSDTHYLATEGAVKQGLANYNERNLYFAEGAFNRFKVAMMQAGILLDKDHNADDSEISMMTQVVSACAALGYNWNEANEMYKALAILAEQGISNLTQSLADKLNTNNNLKFQKFIANVLVKALGNGSKTKDGLIYTISLDILSAYKLGHLTDNIIQLTKIPVSDPTIFNKIQSAISSILTSDSIRMKFKGVLAVLVPSHEMVKLHGGKLASDYRHDFNIEVENDMQKRLRDGKSYLPIEEAKIGTTYRIFRKDLVLNPDNSVKSSIFSEDKMVINPIDVVLIQAPYMLESGVYGNPNKKYIGYYDLLKLYDSENYVIVEDIVEGRNLGAYYCEFTGSNGKKYNFYNLKVVNDLYTLSDKYDKNSETIKLEKARLVAELLKTLSDLMNGKTVEVISYNKGKITSDGYVSGTDLEITPYEVIMPKTMATKLGLNENDSLSDLLEKPDLFKTKLVENLRIGLENESNYTLALKALNGNHTYLLDKKQISSFTGTKLPVTIVREGEDYWYMKDGKKVRKMSSLQDLIYTINGKEIIVTDNLEFFINDSQYHTVQLSRTNAFNTLSLLSSNIRKLLNSKKLRNQSWRKWLLEGLNYSKDSELSSNYFYINLVVNNLSVENGLVIFKTSTLKNGQVVNMNVVNNYILSLGDEMYTSFKKTLDIIAARIPALSMQSFMPMKVVGYTQTNTNQAYVSTHQIWLEGSDFDIDCVSLLTYELNDSGTFVGWSPYFELTSEKIMNISTKFSFPTGKETNIYKLDTSDNTQNIMGKAWINGELSENRENQIKNYLDSFYKDVDLLFDENGELLSINEDNLKVLVRLVSDISKKGILTYEGYVPNSLSKFVKNKKLDNFYLKLKEVVDYHNLYIKNSNAPIFTKNYIVHLMITIAKDPRNLVQALTSVDQTTSEFKKIANESAATLRLKKASPGNMMNILLAIEDNHVGKEVIGISATGLKAFFAMTLYVNTVLQSGDLNKIKSLRRNIEFGKDRKKYGLIANANTDLYKGFDAEVKSEIQGLVEQLKDTSLSYNDAALKISALLSLATDNAKELCLAKLNANPLLAGMYIYGLTMNIPVKELSDVIMTSVGDVFVNYLKGSILSEELLLRTIDDVTKYLGDPYKKMLSLLRKTSHKEATSPLQYLKYVHNHLSRDTKELVNPLKRSLDHLTSYGRRNKLRKVIDGLYNNNKKPTITQIVKALLNTGDKSIINGLTYPLDLSRNEDINITIADINNALKSKENKNKISEYINSEYDKLQDLEIEIAGNDYSYELYALAKKILTTWGINGENKTLISLGPENLYSALFKLLQSPNTIGTITDELGVERQPTLLEILDTILIVCDLGIDNLEPKDSKHDTKERRIAIRSLNRFKEAAINIAKVYLNPLVYNDFKMLYGGAKEMRVLGTLLSGNLGIKNRYEDYITFTDTLSRALSSQNANVRNGLVPFVRNEADTSALSEKGNIERIDLQKFNSDPEYKLKVIATYDTIKHTINILDVVDTVPHYNAYSKAIIEKHVNLYNSSIRHRFVFDNYNSSYFLGYVKSSLKVRMLLNLCDYKLINKFLQTQSVWIPEGLALISVNSEITEAPLTENIPLRLGTEGANATFKKFMDEVVIPDLKKGINHGPKLNNMLLDNEFIKSLVPNLYTRNPSKISSISYKPNINMSPRIDEEKAKLELLLSEFDKLSNQYYYVGENRMPIKDLFYLYNLISYRGAIGLSTMTSIFDNYTEELLPYNYRNFISDLDFNQDLNFGLSKDEAETWLIPIGYHRYGNEGGSFNITKNKDTLTTDIEVRIALGSEKQTLFSIDNKYTNYVLTRPILTIDRIEHNGKLIDIDIRTGTVLTLPDKYMAIYSKAGGWRIEEIKEVEECPV